MRQSHSIRVLIVDDHAIVRRGLRGLLEITDDMDVVGDAADGEQAIRLAEVHEPDVILMDLVMPVKDGISAIREIKARHPATEIVALTSFIEEDKVVAALEAGAAGYLLKDADERAVIEAIRAAHDGEIRLDPAVTKLLAERLRRRPVHPPVEPLTERELEVLVLLGRGLSNKEIATELGIADCTARTHVSNVLGKLGLASRTQAALYAVEHGIRPKPVSVSTG
ncbi:MAG TPA: response regulator transcription factor [Candidatus Limnocylindrales bacterium]|nr:response regulator transcription factor [Candidatus Limnocylindrales bacterium]